MKKTIALLALLISLSSPAFATDPAPLTGGSVTALPVTIGSSAVTVIPADGNRKFLQIQNVSTNSNTLACTVDGTTPVIGSVGVHLAGSTTGAGGTATYDTFVPYGAVKCIGSASSTNLSINYQP